jgi:molybdopterin converting factor small subunit
MTRIEKIRSRCCSCFIVHGRLNEDQDELDELKIISDCIHDLCLSQFFAVGINAVNECIEEKMLQHIKETVPELRSSLKKKHDEYNEELNKIGTRTRSSHEIAFDYQDSMTGHIQRNMESKQDAYRTLIEDFSSETNKIEVKKLFPSKIPRKISSVDETSLLLLAKEIKYLGDQGRGFVNSCFCGNDKVLEKYVLQFSESFDTVATTFIEGLFAVFDTDVLGPTVKNLRTEYTMKDLNNTAEEAIREVVSEEREKALSDKDWEIECCQLSLLTTNTHYLEDSADKFYEKLMEDYTSLEDLESSFKTLCYIQAFMKVRKKMLADNIQMKSSVVLKKLPEKIKKKVNKVLFSENTLANINESPEVVTKRDYYARRLEILNLAINEMRNL